ncbi:MAG TPA: ferritin-like domain-containing protein [Candidatus Binatia bacterium]
MGSKGREIVGMDVNRVLELLNKALADEWLAYYQYWLGSKVVAGPMKDAVIAELIQHAADELRHADMVVQRIVQLGGTPLTSPEQWFKWTNCGYDAPDDPGVQKVLKQNIKGEQCAITTYNAIMQEVAMKDPITYNMVVQILQDEVTHEEDLQSLAEDLSALLKK